MQNRHIGSQVLAAAKLNGDLLLGTVMGGVAFSLARLPGHAFTAYLCCFAFLAILVAAVIRVRCAAPAAALVNLCHLLACASETILQYSSGKQRRRDHCLSLSHVTCIAFAGCRPMA